MNKKDFAEFICVQGMQLNIKKLGKERVRKIIEAFINPVVRLNYRKIYHKAIEKVY